ncbi:integrase, catalytic region, zinc finger, CCHC-type containing protein [Tanacetum coccineum]
MATMAENVIALGKENGEMLIDSIKNGTFKLKEEITFKGTDGVTYIKRLQTPDDLAPKERLRYDSDIKAVNIILLGLPIDIYTLINIYQISKEIWDHPGESIHSYYMRYAKLINDMNMIEMSKSNMQINTKFLNHLQPPWSRFVTTAKHARDWTLVLCDVNDTAKDLWDALKRQMHGSKYSEQDRKAAILYEYDTFFQRYEREAVYGTLMRQTKNLMDINIDALYNILKQNQGDVNDAICYKKKAVVVTLDPLTLVAKKMKVTKSRKKVVVQSKFEGSDDEDMTSSSTNKKPEYMKSKEKKEYKKADEKKQDMSKVKCYNFKKEGHFAKDCKKAKVKDYNYYKTKMLLAKKDGSFGFRESLAFAKETIAEVSYYSFDSESESEYETSEYYDNSTNYGLFKRIEKANQQSKDLENQNKDLQDKYDVLENQVNTFEEKNNKFNEQIKALNEKNDDLLAQTKVLQEQIKVKHVVIDTHTDGQAQYAKLEEEIYQYMIRYSALCDNDKQHRKKIDEQEILFDKMSRQLVEMNNNVLRLQKKILEKQTRISELEEFVHNKDLELKSDKMYNGRKGIGFENPSYFSKAKELRPNLYDERVIGLGYMIRSGYQQKDRKPSQNDKTEAWKWKDCAKSRPKSKNAKVRVNTEESAVKPEPELKNTI